MLAVHEYDDANSSLPRYVEGKGGKPLLSWRVRLHPHLGQGALYKQFDLDEPWDGDANKKLLAQMPDVFRVGFEEKGATATYYRAFAGPGTAFEPGRKVTLAGIPDGTSNTIGVIEAGPPVEWTRPADLAYDPKKGFPKLAGPFKNVVMAGMMDGAVVPLKPDLDRDVFRRLIERADGNPVDRDTAATFDVKP